MVREDGAPITADDIVAACALAKTMVDGNFDEAAIAQARDRVQTKASDADLTAMANAFLGLMINRRDGRG